MKKAAAVLSVFLVCLLVIYASGSKSSGAVSSDPERPYAGTTLTWWLRSNANVEVLYDNLGDTPWAKYVMEKTGIEIRFIQVKPEKEKEEFEKMVRLGSLPDIIEYEWTDYPGGPQKAIDDGVIISLSPLLESNAPNLSSVLRANPSIAKMIKSSGGNYYCFPFLRGLTEPNITQFSSGFILRQDVLDKLGLERPETIDEWEKVLRAFRNYGFVKPFVTRYKWMIDVWSPGFDNWGDFYVDNGIVHNGLIEDSRYRVLQKLHQWYSEGLIDNDYMSAEKKQNEKDFTSGKAGACYAPFGQGLGNFTTIMHSLNKNITEDDIRATVPVTSEKGKNAKFSKMSQLYDSTGRSAAISSKCRNVDAAMWLLDWMYGEEGTLCCNFGIPGVSYVMKDGVPTYTQAVSDNPDYPFATALAIYTRASTSGVCIQDEDYIRQYYKMDNQKEALMLSLKTDMAQHFFPPVGPLEEDSDDFAEIMSDITEYSGAMESAFISGEVPLTKERWRQYVAQLRDFGFDEALSMMQNAYDEYMSR